ncbi:MAG: RecX family transcriptional regulator [Candidatus Kapabacteria bacterium]|nr:RecX family transcriptional regulator [Candidatus Kapabacteria bacterium]
MNEYKIISIVKQKFPSTDFSVSLDSGECFELSSDLVFKNSLSNGVSINEETLKQIKLENESISAKQTAYGFCSYKPRSEHQLRQKLNVKDFSDEAKEIAIDYMKQIKYIDDMKFALDYAKALQLRKNMPLNKIKSELYQKGISKFDIEDTLHQFADEDNELNSALRAIHKKLKNKKFETDTELKYFIIQLLIKSGFSSDIARSATEKYLNNE